MDNKLKAMMADADLVAAKCQKIAMEAIADAPSKDHAVGAMMKPAVSLAGMLAGCIASDSGMSDEDARAETARIITALLTAEDVDQAMLGLAEYGTKH